MTLSGIENELSNFFPVWRLFTPRFSRRVITYDDDDDDDDKHFLIRLQSEKHSSSVERNSGNVWQCQNESQRQFFQVRQVHGHSL
jgi:hypothetical protein